jgi:hypothetical protein
MIYVKTEPFLRSFNFFINLNLVIDTIHTYAYMHACTITQNIITLTSPNNISLASFNNYRYISSAYEENVIMADPSYAPTSSQPLAAGPSSPTAAAGSVAALSFASTQVISPAYVSYAAPTGTILGIDATPPPVSLQSATSSNGSGSNPLMSPAVAPRGLTINPNLAGSTRSLFSPTAAGAPTPSNATISSVPPTPSAAPAALIGSSMSTSMMMSYGAGATPRAPPSTPMNAPETRESNKNSQNPVAAVTSLSSAARLPSAVRPFRDNDTHNEYLAYSRLNDGSLAECDASLSVSFAASREDRQNVVPSMYSDARHTSFYANYLQTAF